MDDKRDLRFFSSRDLNEEDRFGKEERFGTESVVERDVEVVYKPPSHLKIPESIKDKFKSKGFYLRWNRLLLDGQVDAQNLRTKLSKSEGYSFVNPEELDEEDLLELGDTEALDRYGEVVVSRDMVLMKVRVEHAESRRKYYQERTKQQAEANELLRRQNQVENNSRSIVRTGKTAHFSS